MEQAPKSNIYFAPPGTLPKLGQRLWTPDEDQQLRRLLAHFKILPGDTVNDIREKGQCFNRIWNDHLRTGERVVIPN